MNKTSFLNLIIAISFVSVHALPTYMSESSNSEENKIQPNSHLEPNNNFQNPNNIINNGLPIITTNKISNENQNVVSSVLLKNYNLKNNHHRSSETKDNLRFRRYIIDLKPYKPKTRISVSKMTTMAEEDMKQVVIVGTRIRQPEPELDDIIKCSLLGGCI